MCSEGRPNEFVAFKKDSGMKILMNHQVMLERFTADAQPCADTPLVNEAQCVRPPLCVTSTLNTDSEFVLLTLNVCGSWDGAMLPIKVHKCLRTEESS